MAGVGPAVAAAMPSSSSGIAAPASKSKGNSGKRFTHRLNYRQQVVGAEELAALQLAHGQELARRQIERACGLALRAVGFDGAEKLAVESFGALVEEYMNHFLRSVIKSMQASRRRTAVPRDFQLALEEHNLTLNSLLIHLDPPVVSSSTTSAAPDSRKPLLSSRSEILPTLTAESVSASSFSGIIEPGTSTGASRPSPTIPLDDASRTKQEALLNSLLNSTSTSTSTNESQQPATNGIHSSSTSSSSLLPRPLNVPPGFPALPSQHTYRSQAVFASRERDPQKIRERATEEGRLGEEALRRLAAKQAELRREREEREEKEQQQQQQQAAAAAAAEAAAAAAESSATTTTTSGRKRKANAAYTSLDSSAASATAAVGVGAGPGAAQKAARTAAANPASVFRSRADDMFRNLMAGVGSGEESGENGMGVDGAPSAGAGAGVDVGMATMRDGDWNGGLNEPVNAERIYWRQVPKRSGAAGG